MAAKTLSFVRLPVTVTWQDSRSQVTDVPLSASVKACSIAAVQWPQLMSGTLKIIVYTLVVYLFGRIVVT